MIFDNLDFVSFAEQESLNQRVHEVHKLVYKLPQANFEMLDMVIRHLTEWVLLIFISMVYLSVRNYGTELANYLAKGNITMFHLHGTIYRVIEMRIMLSGTQDHYIVIDFSIIWRVSRARWLVRTCTGISSKYPTAPGKSYIFGPGRPSKCISTI